MKISLINAGKRFNRDWIFRNIHYEFTAGNAYAITGPNGSGKSTLLQVIGGAIAQSEGKIEYTIQGSGYKVQDAEHEAQDTRHQVQGASTQAATEDAYKYLSIAAPYLEVIEEMTVTELLNFHRQFKPFLPGIDVKKIIAIVGLEQAAHKQIRYYSSGMKQRVKLAQAIFSDVPCVLLDEPCTNLDVEGIALYRQLIAGHAGRRLLIVSSNDEQEYGFCQHKISILDYKKNTPA